jgi:mannose-1-phosphate guanylyltransferase
VDAVLLVGGQGTRLRPLTISTPKPMLPTAGVPFLTHQLARARDAGVDHAILSTSYKPEVFEGYFGDGSAFGLRISYVTEAEPLGTGGGIRNVADLLRGDDFIVFNGDVLSGLDIEALVRHHKDAGADVTLHLTEVDDPRAFGMVPLDADGRVTAFLEKPQRPEQIVTNRINAGCYVFAHSILDRIPTGRPVSVERETFPALLADGLRVMGHVDSSYWLDLGTPAAFVRGSVDLVQRRIVSSAVPGNDSDAVLLEGADVAADATVSGGTTVGARSVVGAGAVVEGSVLFDDVVVEAGALVRSSAIGRGARVGANAVLDGAVVGDGASIGARNELLNGARIWPGVVLADGALRFSSDQ